MGVPHGTGDRILGRATERDHARRCLQSGRGVLFAGPDGVGRTALARAALADVAGPSPSSVATEHRGIQSVWVDGTAAEPSTPFSAFAALFPGIGARIGPPADPLQLLQRFRAAFVERAAGRPLILAVDDAHRLDPQSAGLVFQLAAERRAIPVLTAVSGERAPDAVRALWKDDLVERLDIGPLDRWSTARLVRDLLDRPPAGQTVVDLRSGPRPAVAAVVNDTIWRVSAGYPLYARELVHAGCQGGWLVVRDGVWHTEGRLDIGPRLMELVSERLAPLDAAERETLRLVSFAGTLPVTVLHRLVGEPPLQALGERGLLTFEPSHHPGDPVSHPGDRVSRPAALVTRAAHPLLAYVARQQAAPDSAARTALLLADAFDADGRLESDLDRVITWRLDAGAHPRHHQLVAASRLAGSRQDWRTAARLADAAAGLQPTGQAILALAEAYRALGRDPEALAALDGRPFESDDELARAAVLRACASFFGSGDLPGALQTLRSSAHREIRSASGNSAWFRGIGSGLLGFAGRPAAAAEQALRVLAEPALDRRAELTARAALSVGLAWTGHYDRAVETLDGLDPGGDPIAEVASWSVAAQFVAHRYSGRLDRLEQVAQARYDLGVQMNDAPMVRGSAVALGWSALARARLAPAIAWFREGADAPDSVAGRPVRARSLLGLTEALAHAGDVDEAREALEAARPAAEHDTLLAPLWSVAAAWLAAACGPPGQALEQLELAAGRARSAGQPAAEFESLHTLTLLGYAGAAPRLGELSTWMEGPLIQIVAAHAAALAGDTTGGTLDSAVERYAELGLHLYAAEAAAQACRAHRAAGDPRRAAAAAAQGRILLGPMDDGPAPLGLVLALTSPELTRREREVAVLAARGMASPAIASRLCLSVRTVETHLARVYSKLGIGGRAELASALAGPGATALPAQGRPAWMAVPANPRLA